MFKVWDNDLLLAARSGGTSVICSSFSIFTKLSKNPQPVYLKQTEPFLYYFVLFKMLSYNIVKLSVQCEMIGANVCVRGILL